MFKRLVATSRAPQIMVLSMLRSSGKIEPQIDQIWAWLSRGHRWSAGFRNPLNSSVTGPSLLVNCYLEIKFHKIIRVNPPGSTDPLNVLWPTCVHTIAPLAVTVINVHDNLSLSFMIIYLYLMSFFLYY